METARAMVREALPVKCMEAVVLVRLALFLKKYFCWEFCGYFPVSGRLSDQRRPGPGPLHHQLQVGAASAAVGQVSAAAAAPPPGEEVLLSRRPGGQPGIKN